MKVGKTVAFAVCWQVEQISMLSAFIDAEVTFHQHSLDLLMTLAEVLKSK
jgi:hypothetical protein